MATLPRPQNDTGQALRTALAQAFDMIEVWEPWREVGATDQPAFQGTWVNFGGGIETCAFRKDVMGNVHLKGQAKSGVVSALTPIFILPPGYRPGKLLGFAVPSNNLFGQLDITAAGFVAPVVGNNASFNINVSFRPVAP